MTCKLCINVLMIKYCDKLSEMAGYTFFKISENGRFTTFHSSNYIATFSFCSNKCSIVIFQFVCICLFRLLPENQKFALHTFQSLKVTNDITQKYLSFVKRKLFEIGLKRVFYLNFTQNGCLFNECQVLKYLK